LKAAVSSISYDGVTRTTKFHQNGDVVGKGFEKKTLPWFLVSTTN
jgi:hypothetical protein